MSILILAGGLGTRLRTAVPDLPKPLAPISGRPFLHWLLDALAIARPTRFVLAVSYLADQIIASVGATFAGIDVEYSIETVPMGTGGAIAKVFQERGEDRALVVNGDTFQQLPFEAMIGALDAGADIVMAVRRVDDTSRYGRVSLKGTRVVGFEEKGAAGPGLINAGAYGVARSAFAAGIPDGAFSFEKDILVRRLGELVVTAVEVDGDFIDIGIPEDFARAQSAIPHWSASARERAR